MFRLFFRLTAAFVCAAALAACAGAPQMPQPSLAIPTTANNEAPAQAPSADNSRTAVAIVDHPMQCVPYARLHSGVELYGDAYTWWKQAAGRFARSQAPKEGAVMVLSRYAGRARAHVAIVRKIASSREISIDHANWYGDGAIYVDDPVLDVSAENNWSRVRVWNIRTGSWGERTYAVQGFIGPDPDTLSPRVADSGLAKNP